MKEEIKFIFNKLGVLMVDEHDEALLNEIKSHITAQATKIEELGNKVRSQGTIYNMIIGGLTFSEIEAIIDENTKLKEKTNELEKDDKELVAELTERLKQIDSLESENARLRDLAKEMWEFIHNHNEGESFCDYMNGNAVNEDRYQNAYLEIHIAQSAIKGETE